MVNNFELFGNYIESVELNEDEFFYIIVFRRNKDGFGPEGYNPNSSLQKFDPIKGYYVNSKKMLMDYESEIVSLCKFFNARAYIYPSKMSLKTVSKNILRSISDCLDANSFKNLRVGLLSSVIDSSVDRLIVVDIDEDGMKYFDEIKEYLGENVILEVPTLHGKHFISKRMNFSEFESKFPPVSLHSGTPTILFIN